MVTFRKTWLAIALLALATSTLAGGRDPALAGFFSAPLRIVSGDDEHRIVAYLAVTDAQKIHGLMYVRDLPADQGMLFVYEQPWHVAMWMKNTYIPLDMLFIRADGSIASIVADTTPESLTEIRAEEPVTGVLELNAGTAARLGIEPGDRVVYRAFSAGKTAPAADTGS